MILLGFCLPTRSTNVHDRMRIPRIGACDYILPIKRSTIAKPLALFRLLVVFLGVSVQGKPAGENGRSRRTLLNTSVSSDEETWGS